MNERERKHKWAQAKLIHGLKKEMVKSEIVSLTNRHMFNKVIRTEKGKITLAGLKKMNSLQKKDYV
jgi:hypothetical protein